MLSRLIAWLRDAWTYLISSPARMAAVVIALAAGLIAGVPVHQAAFNYEWADHRFCDDCHVHDYANEAYERSVHFGLTTCHDCHLVPIRHYPRNLVVTLIDTPQTEDDIHRPDVSSVICTRCHAEETDDEPLTGPMTQEVRERVVKVDDSPLHRSHLESTDRVPSSYAGGTAHEGDHGAEEEHDTPVVPHGGVRPSWDGGEITCMDCHGSENNRAHRFEATRDNCLQCHEGVEQSSGRLAQLECRECHFRGFLGDLATE
jgi:hypothetical protein